VWNAGEEIKNKKRKYILMPAYYANYATRRTMQGIRGSSYSSESWGRNRNAVRHNPRIVMGPVTRIAFIVTMVVFIGLLFLSQSAKVTDYDIAIASVDTEIANLEAQRDALVVENAKITAAAANEDTNEVAAAMVTASSADFVRE
jgi:hypothetical protein